MKEGQTVRFAPGELGAGGIEVDRVVSLAGCIPRRTAKTSVGLSLSQRGNQECAGSPDRRRRARGVAIVTVSRECEAETSRGAPNRCRDAVPEPGSRGRIRHQFVRVFTDGVRHCFGDSGSTVGPVSAPNRCRYPSSRRQPRHSLVASFRRNSVPSDAMSHHTGRNSPSRSPELISEVGRPKPVLPVEYCRWFAPRL